MKKVLLFFLVLVFFVAVWYGESRRFVSFPSGNIFTVWKTYNNKCYIIAGKYYGLFMPSLNHTFIETTNTSLTVDLILEKDSNTILAQVDSGSILHSIPLAKIKIADYNLNKMHNDSIYTYFDTKLKLKRYKKNITIISIPINGMGAL